MNLGEGATPLEEDARLAAWAGVERLWLKREDRNPTGSHKDRGAAMQLGRLLEDGARVAVISSSGNAALAAATYAKAAGVTLVALLSPLTAAPKVEAIRAASGRVVVTPKPINYSRRLARVCGWPDLRPSQSAEALDGFRGLGQELAAELPGGVALFGYASSGTTFQAVGEVLARSSHPVSLHPVQAGLINGISRAFGRPGDGLRSVVGDLGVKVSPRAEEVIALVRGSAGQAWWVDDQSIAAAGDTLARHGYLVAPECWAGLAGVRLAAKHGAVGESCLLLTGRAWPDPGGAAGVPPSLSQTFQQVLDQVADLR